MFQVKYLNSQQSHENTFSSTCIIRKKHIKTTTPETTSLPTKMTRTRAKIVMIWKTGNLHSLLLKCKMMKTLQKTVWQINKILNIRVTTLTWQFHSQVYSQEIKTCSQNFDSSIIYNSTTVTKPNIHHLMTI